MSKISLLFSAYILIITAKEGYSQDSVSFQSEALASKKSCSELTRDDCMFFHEAMDKCTSVCNDKINNKDDTSKTKGKAKNGKAKGKGCFHGDDLVITERWGAVPLSRLAGEKGVRVLARASDGQARFSPIFYWIHASPSLKHDFIEFRTQSGHVISLTKDHLIYAGKCGPKWPKKALFAERVRPGSCVYVQDGRNFTESRVADRRLTQKRGIFNPVTEQGNVVVNGVLASCYACLENEPLQKIMYAYLDFVRRLLSVFWPQNFVAMFYSEPFSDQVGVPEVVFSFWDLAKKFVV